MILHIGGDIVIPMKDIIVIIDLESTAMAKDTKAFLKIARQEGLIQKVSEDPPKSFILVKAHKKAIVYYSPISSVTLMKRSGYIEEIRL